MPFLPGQGQLGSISILPRRLRAAVPAVFLSCPQRPRSPRPCWNVCAPPHTAAYPALACAFAWPHAYLQCPQNCVAAASCTRTRYLVCSEVYGYRQVLVIPTGSKYEHTHFINEKPAAERARSPGTTPHSWDAAQARLKLGTGRSLTHA